MREDLRHLFDPAPGHLIAIAGRLAEALRRDPAYRASRAIYAEPHPCLQQIRINCLLDGKRLLMPTAGLKEGFTLTEPFSVPFRALSYAVSLKGQMEHGRKVKTGALYGLDIGLLAAAGGMVDPAGVWLGNGKGFLDLVYAILKESSALAPAARVYAVPSACLVEKIPPRPWDVRVNAILEGEVGVPCGDEQVSGKIFWAELAKKRIKKITPLWQLHKRGH